MRFERFATRAIDWLIRLTGYRNEFVEAAIRHHGDPDFSQHYRRMMFVFELEGHSGATAAIASRRLYRLMNFKPISPITDDPDLFGENGQCRICPSVFKRKDGTIIDHDRVVFEDEHGRFRAALPEELRRYGRITLPYDPPVRQAYIMEVRKNDNGEPFVVAVIREGEIRDELKKPVKL